MKRGALFTAVTSLCVGVFAAQTYYADWRNGNDSRDGLSTTTAFKSFERLVEAVNAAGSGSTGILAPGEYLLEYSPTCTVENATFKASSFDPSLTILNGQGKQRCLYDVKNYATVANLTVRRGYLNHSGGYGNGDGNGAGLYLSARAVNQPGGIDNYAFVTNCVFDSCTNKCSGSALAVSGGAKVIDCIFTNCWTSTNGGSLAGDNGGGARGGTVFVTLPKANDTLIEKCVFVDNAAATGPGALSSGIYTVDGGVACTNYYGIVLKDCHFIRNKSNSYGGALAAKVREAVRCHFVSNYAATGSGGFCGPEVYKSTDATKPWLAYMTNRIIGCTFVGNSSGGDCGAYSPGLYAWALISNCTFRANSASCYGTLYLRRRLHVTSYMQGCEIADCVFEENESMTDGNYSSIMGCSLPTSVMVNNSLFVSNRVPSWGSALALGSNSVVRNCRFIGNRVDAAGGTTTRFGGAVFFEGPGGLVENCLFVGNTNLTSTWGCCINANNNNYAGKNLKVWNCTFVRNGLNVMYGTHGSATAEAMEGVATYNCLFWRNASDFARPLAWYNCTNCYANVNGFADGSGGNIKGESPKFADPDNDDWTLGSGSPCRNKGYNADWMYSAKDLAGNPRIDKFFGVVDIGCYESRGVGMGVLFK